MKHLLAIVSILCMCILFSFSGPYELSYHTGTLESAKEMALEQNKLVLVKFYADWCVPCKWMDETTFRDPSIVNKINKNFIALKVNIDDFDGFTLRQELGVSILPTIIIYNTDGKMVKRIEETLPVSKMILSLDDVISNNGKRIVHHINQAPENTIKPSPQKPIATYKKKVYKLQLGVFKGFENTMNFLEDIKDKIDAQALVLHDYKDGYTMYKVLIGRYKTISEAEDAQNKLISVHGLDSVIY